MCSTSHDGDGVLHSQMCRTRAKTRVVLRVLAGWLAADGADAAADAADVAVASCTADKMRGILLSSDYICTHM